MPAIRLIAGLGNPGPDYARTRHNAGFWLIDALADSLGVRWNNDSKLQADTAKARIGDEDVWLLRPRCYMNESGHTVTAALRYWKIEPEESLIAHDDLDLPAGTARLKFDGGHGGQNGLRDIMAILGHGHFNRLRIGIGHPGHKDKVTPWVLGRPDVGDEAAIRRSIDDALAVIPLVVSGDFNEAMKRLHTAQP